MNLLRAFFLRISREPVLVGAAFIAWSQVWWPDASDAAKVAVGATVALGQRMFSTARATSEENVVAAKDQGANEAVVLMAAKPKPAAKKAAPRRRTR